MPEISPRARELSTNALKEYPQDHELSSLERLARQGVEKSSEAKTLATEAQTLSSEGHFEEAVASLKKALELDPKSKSIREALVNALIGQAQPLVDVDWRAAEPLMQQATDLDASHAGARSLRTLIADAKRKEFVSHCLAEARDLQAGGDADSALGKIESGLTTYPNELRLLQLQSTIQNSVRDARRTRERAGDLETLRAIKQKVEQPANAGEIGTYLEQSAVILQKHPDDPEIGSLAAEIERWATASASPRSKVPRPSDTAATIILDSGSAATVATPATGPAGGSSAPVAPPPPVADPAQSDATGGRKTRAARCTAARSTAACKAYGSCCKRKAKAARGSCHGVEGPFAIQPRNHRWRFVAGCRGDRGYLRSRPLKERATGPDHGYGNHRGCDSKHARGRHRDGER